MQRLYVYLLVLKYLGRLIKETDPLNNTITYSYDSKGNLISKTNADGNTITYIYDAIYRLLQSVPTKLQGKDKEQENKAEIFTYDPVGNRQIGPDANDYYSYNQGNQLTSDRKNQYEYDAMGDRISMTTPEDKVITYKYDANNRLIEISSEGQIFSFVYDNLGRRVKLINPNGTYTAYSYDKNSRLTELVHKDSKGAIINSFIYAHDKVGNRLSKTEIDKKTSYTYDPLYRLTEALSSTPGYSSNTKGKGSGVSNATQQQKEFYTYDSVGNRLTSDNNKTYAYNTDNQLISVNGSTYTYDKNGNLISKIDGTTTFFYSYDYENRLTKVIKTENGTTTAVEFKYDPFGRRIEKKITENGIITTKRYVYDNEDILFEYDDNGKIGNRYIHGLGIDEPLALTTSQGTYYYHVDGLGSVVALTDSSQKVVQDYQYDSFGNLKDQKERIKQPYTFTAREWDKETGLYYYRARYYDAKVGRFISFDPILHPANGELIHSRCRQVQKIFAPSFWSLKTNPQKLHPYVYVGNNPINLTDPTGLSSKCCGEWRGKAFRFINVWCRCCWLCVPPGGVIWSGNWFAQPCTNGQIIYTGGGGLKRGDSCLCKDPDGGGHILSLEK